MTIITWNCNMAFRKKAALICREKPDILVIQECEQPDKLQLGAAGLLPSAQLWFGSNPHKGIGIFSFSGFALKLHPAYADSFKLVIPVIATRNAERYLIFAIWANNPGDPEGAYITQVWKAIHHYSRLIRSTNTMLVGDFNSNTIWDRPRRIGNHSTLVHRLEKKKIVSVYHWYFAQEQGKEAHPTWYMYRHADKPYHLDYCFVSADLANRLAAVEVGNYTDWRAHSDHVPLITRFHTVEQTKDKQTNNAMQRI